MTGPVPGPARGARLDLESVGHLYGLTRAVGDVSLNIDPGEFVTLLGPSGCGKSTLLRILAGLMRQSEGQIRIDGQDVSGLSPAERDVGIVFQNYALFPHMTVASNIAYGLEARHVGDRASIRARVREMIDTVRLTGLENRYPRELSGGQQQRVALARTLAVSPRILLLDEPLGALDKNLRLDMQLEIKRLQRAFAITTVMVTHDQEEALSMSDRVAVMNAGCLEQFDTPTQIYDRPSTAFVATFVGTACLLDARLERDLQRFVAYPQVGGGIALDEPAPCSRVGAVRVAVRPEQWELATDREDSWALDATVELVMPLGPTLIIDLMASNGASLKLALPRANAPALTHGMPVRVRVKPGANPPVFLGEASRIV